MVSVVWDHNRVFIDPWVPRLGPYLTASRQKRKGSKTQTWKEPLFFLHPDGLKTYGVTFGGLHGRVVQALNQLGVEHTSTIRHEFPSEPQWSPALDGIALRKHMPEILCTIAACHRGGVVKCPTGYGKTFLLELLAAVYPDDRILILSAGSALLKSIHARIQKRNPDERIGRVFDRWSESSTRVVVASLQSVHKFNPNEFDTVFVDECHKAGSADMSLSLHGVSLPRMFGLSATPYGRSDDSNLYAEALFGPLIYEVTYQEAVAAGAVADMEVIIVDGPKRPASDTRRYSVFLEMEYIWHHAGRHIQLARLAGMFLPEEKVIVFVRHVEHGARLRQYMPEATLAYGCINQERKDELVKANLLSPDDPLKPDTERILLDLQEGRITRVIATRVWEAGIDVPDLAAIIRGDGLMAEVPLVQQSGRGSRLTDEKRKAWIIDINDTAFKSRIKGKKRLYKSNGWKVHEVSSVAEATDILHT